MANQILAVLLLTIFLSGCSEPLRTLIKVNSEQESNQDYIAERQRKFNQLLSDIEANKLKLGLTTQQVQAAYGEPIYVKEIEGQKRFLYRDPLEKSPKQKVYLYFDRQDKLGDFERVDREEGMQQSQQAAEENIAEPQPVLEEEYFLEAPEQHADEVVPGLSN
jgi:outer membrane protein assembly factor BamE (lipoprotein component of BamABCDE complex)